MAFTTGPVLGLAVAENSKDPGTGRLCAAVTSVPDPDSQGVLNTILWTPATRVHDATRRRFPDLAVRPGWDEIANALPDDREVAQAVADDLALWDEEGGCVAVWDAPATFARLEPYGFTPPRRVIDLKILNRVMLPNHRGHRTPYSMALMLRVPLPENIMPGVEREAQAAQHLGEVIGTLVADDRLPHVHQQPYSWQDMMAMQDTACHTQMAGLVKWLRSQNKPTGDVRTGWPVWD